MTELGSHLGLFIAPATETCLSAWVSDGLAATVSSEDAAHPAAKTGVTGPQLRILNAGRMVGSALDAACAIARRAIRGEPFQQPVDAAVAVLVGFGKEFKLLLTTHPLPRH